MSLGSLFGKWFKESLWRNGRVGGGVRKDNKICVSEWVIIVVKRELIYWGFENIF